MTTTVRDIMTTNVVNMPKSTSIKDAATQMRKSGIGDILVTAEDGSLFGILTDRDIVVRCIAEDRDVQETKLGDVCSTELVTLSPDSGIDEGVKAMRDNAVRRLPVVEGDKTVGILSIGDLAIERDRKSALADISAKPPNR